MKKIFSFLAATVIIAGLLLAAGCSKKSVSDNNKPPVSDPNKPVSDPTGTVTANISTSTEIDIPNIGVIKWTSPDNFNASCVGGYSAVSICDLGTMKGLGNITNNPATGYSSPQSSNTTVACEAGRGYVFKFEGTYAVTQYVRLYVVDAIVNTSGGIMGEQVKYLFTIVPGTLTVSKDSLPFTKDAGTQNVTVTTNAADYTYSCSDGWITATKNGNTLAITTLTNTSSTVPRAGTVTVGINSASKVVKIQQAATSLAVSKDSLSFTGAQGTQNITITTDASAWNYSCSDSWLTATKTGNTLAISVSANSQSFSSRSGTVIVQADAQQKAITVQQAAPTSTSAPYAVGDVYKENGVAGVVYKISSGGTHGMLVSPTETRCVWSTESIVTGCTDMDNGMNNMNIIKKIAGWQTKYPAFAWCDALNTGGITGWYLPAKNELNDLYTVFATINRTLSTGATLISGDFYWSSTENNISWAWVEYSGIQNYSSKDYYYNNFVVCAVRVF